MELKLIEKFKSTQLDITKVEQDISKATVVLQKKLLKLREQDNEIRGAIKKAMEDSNTKTFENDFLKITYVAPSVRKSIDTTKLKEFEPKIYDKYLRESPISSSVRIKVK